MVFSIICFGIPSECCLARSALFSKFLVKNLSRAVVTILILPQGVVAWTASLGLLTF